MRAFIVFALAAALLGACQSEQETTVEQQAASTVGAPEAAVPVVEPTPELAVDPAVVAEEEARKRGEITGPMRRFVELTLPEGGPTGLPVALESLDAGATPVLLPTTGEFDEGFGVLGEGWYTISAKTEGLHIAASGNAKPIVHSHLEKSTGDRSALLAGETYEITRIHGIASIHFVRFGAMYTLDFECDAVFDDVRCTEDEALIAMMNSMQWAGGAR